MGAGALADVHPLGVAAHQSEHGFGDEAIVEHHIGLLHQTQRAKGEQIWISGTSADQIDLSPGRAVLPGARQQGFQLAAGRGGPAAVHQLGDAAREDPLPESAPFGLAVDMRAHRGAVFTGESGELAGAFGQQCFDARAQHAGQDRGRAAAADGQAHRVAIDDGRKGYRTEFGLIDDIDGDAARPGGTIHGAVDRRSAGGRYHEHGAIQIGCTKAAAHQDQHIILGKLLDFRAASGGDDPDAGAGGTQQLELAGSHPARADQHAGLPAQAVEQWQGFHVRRCARSRPDTAAALQAR